MEELVNFLNKTPNWEEVISEAPYFVKVKWNDDHSLFLLKYTQGWSVFSNPIVQECRGSIFNVNNSGIIPVCIPFKKFGNLGEDYIPEIDWSRKIEVQEKVDGSLIKLWWHLGWHVSTNGTIDAYRAEVNDTGLTFGKLFDDCFSSEADKGVFFDSLNHEYTYMFELVSPFSQVVIPYKETKLYFLGRRNNSTFREDKEYNLGWEEYDIRQTRVYPLNSFSECLEATSKMSKDKEGFVVCDTETFDRVKVKSLEYLAAARARNNGNISIKYILEMYQGGRLDDFLAYAPEYEDFVSKVVEALKRIANQIEEEVKSILKYPTRKELALNVADYRHKAYIFKEYNKLFTDIEEYLFNMNIGTFVELVKREMENA